MSFLKDVKEINSLMEDVQDDVKSKELTEARLALRSNGNSFLESDSTGVCVLMHGGRNWSKKEFSVSLRQPGEHTYDKTIEYCKNDDKLYDEIVKAENPDRKHDEMSDEEKLAYENEKFVTQGKEEAMVTKVAKDLKAAMDRFDKDVLEVMKKNGYARLS